VWCFGSRINRGETGDQDQKEHILDYRRLMPCVNEFEPCEARDTATPGATSSSCPPVPTGTPPAFCASQLYLGGMDLLAIQEALGHAWVAR
jgi:hypothetical protein